MDTHKPRKQSGRAAFDEPGNASWEWQGESGRFGREIGTQRLRTIEPDLRSDGNHLRDLASIHDPYNNSTVHADGQPRPRKRTLDDLRRLSEEIKAAREKKERGSQ
jgi:hypothetical protein